MWYQRLIPVIVLTGVWQMSMFAQPLSGTYTIVGVGQVNNPNTEFETIQQALTALQTRGANGDVVITLPPGTQWHPSQEPTILTLSTYTCTGCNVSLVLDTTVSLDKSPASSAGSRFVFRITGTIQNFTIDGKGKFRFKSTTSAAGSGTGTAVIGLVSTATLPLVVQNFRVKDLILAGSGIGTTGTYAGIYLGPDASLTTGSLLSTSNVSGVTIEGCRIDTLNIPLHLRAARPLAQNLTVSGNQIGLTSVSSWGGASNTGGIHVLGWRNVTIRQNRISGVQTSTNYQIAGIRLDTCENFLIEANWIHGIRYTGDNGWGEYGIFVQLPSTFAPTSTHRILNNMIADIVGDAWNSFTGYVSGIAVNATAALTNARLSIYHNSIHLFGNNTNSNYASGTPGEGSVAISIGGNISGGVDIQGNILQNTLRTSQAGSKAAYGIIFFSTAALTSVTVNYNAYYIMAPGVSSNHIGRVGSTINPTYYTTFSAWQGAPFNPEGNGIELPSSVPFTSNIDLHLDPTVATLVVNRGNSAFNGVIQDYDGQNRPLPNPPPGAYNDPGTHPDIGADEVDGTYVSCPSVLEADEISLSPAAPEAGQNIIVSVANPANLSGILTLRWSTNGGVTWTTVGVTPASFPYTIPAPLASNFPAQLRVELIATNVPGCNPPLPTDTARASVTISCPSSFTAGGNTLNIVQDTVLFGATIVLNASPSPAPQYIIQWSHDRSTWNNVMYSGTFPVTIITPSSGLPSIPANLYIRLVAQNYPGCSPTQDVSEIDSVALIERAGNRQSSAIPVSLTYNAGAGRWEATIQDSTNGPGTSNEYGLDGALGGNPRGTGARDVFYLLTLPVCLDSLVLNTCNTGTTYDTRINVINLADPDTTANDDQGLAACPSVHGYSFPQYTSQVRIIGFQGSRRIIPSVPTTPTRDTLTLQRGHQLLIIMEGYSSADRGKFTLRIEGYGPAPSNRPKPSLGADQAVCVSAGTLSLDATTTPAADNYEWVVNGSVVSGVNTPTYDLPLALGTHEVIARAIFNNTRGLNNGAICLADTTADTLLVEVTAPASPPPAMDLGGDRVVCVAAGTLTLSVASGADTYEWSIDGVVVPGATTNTFDLPLAVGTSTVKVRAINNPPSGSACTASLDSEDQIQVTVTDVAPIPPAMNLGADRTVCVSDGPFTFSVASGAQVYEWSVNGNVVATGSASSVNLSLPVGTHLVRVRAINNPPNGSVCGSAISQDEVEVRVTDVAPAPPAMNLGSDRTVCVSEGSITFSVAPGAQVYEWSVNGNVVASGSNPTFNLTLAVGTYTVKVRAINNPPTGSVCVASAVSEDEVVVSVTPAASAPPVMNLGSDRTVCVSEGSITFSVAPGAQVYEWSVNGDVVQSGSSSTFVLSLVVGTHTVRVRAINEPPSGSACTPQISEDEVVITVTPAANQPPVMDLGDPRNLCTSDVFYTFSVEPGADVYEWSVNGDVVQTGSSSVFLFSLAVGTYDIRVRAINNPPSNSVCTEPAVSEDNVLIVVEDAAPAPPAMDLGGDRVVCVSQGSLSFSVSSGADGYEWFVNGSLVQSGIGPFAPTTYTLSLTVGTHSVRVRATNLAGLRGGCANSISEDEITVTVTEAPSQPPVVDLGGDRAICVTEGSLTLSVDAGAEAYEWSVDGNIVAGANGPTFTLPLAVGIYAVQVRAVNNPPAGSVCDPAVTTDEVVIEVSPAPEVAIRAGSTAYENGDTLYAVGEDSISVIFSDSTTTPGNTYTWQVYEPDSTTPTLVSTEDTVSFVFRRSGTYVVILISQNGGCEERDTLYVDVTLSTSTALSLSMGTFAAFPNPNSGTFTVTMPIVGTYELRVVDGAGKVVYAGRIEGTDRTEVRVNLPAGVYQLLISGEGRSACLRLLLVD
ncbi:MAG: T9SS type A sorting domain-containing protein [Bacteroidia bacterium]|nr:T9SS type A sorting domain-containing protein [Bacteroidia bacterium]